MSAISDFLFFRPIFPYSNLAGHINIASSILFIGGKILGIARNVFSLLSFDDLKAIRNFRKGLCIQCDLQSTVEYRVASFFISLFSKNNNKNGDRIRKIQS